jgi:hypothetical protein
MRETNSGVSGKQTSEERFSEFLASSSKLRGRSYGSLYFSLCCDWQLLLQSGHAPERSASDLICELAMPDVGDHLFLHQDRLSVDDTQGGIVPLSSVVVFRAKFI